MKTGNAKAWATGPPAKADHVTASGITVTGSAVVFGTVLTADAAAAELTVYDGTDSNGSKICILKAAAEGSQQANFGPSGIRVEEGIYAGIEGTAAEAVIYYRD